MAVPNMLETVIDCKNKYPKQWAAAHRGGPDTDEFAHIVATACHQKHAQFGLNGKRGNPADISDDCVNWKGEGADTDPTDGNAPRTVIDFISGAGGDNPQPAWAIVTKPSEPVQAAWVQPRATLPAPGPTPDPKPPAVFIPDYERDLGGDNWHREEIGKPLQADMKEANDGPLNDGSVVWFSRIITEYENEIRKANKMIDRAPIVKKYRNQWRAQLDLPPI